MREIKFRFWNEENKKMLYRNLGNPFIERHMNDVITQFTGLLDKNGKEIYEGDIIVSSFSPNKVEVVEINNISHFDGNFSHIQGIGFVTELGIDNLEIIGNIWENPKLLEG